MNGQLPLFDVEGTAATRRAAGESIAGFAGDMRGAVLEFVRSQGAYGAIDEETHQGLGMLSDTARARVELRDAGLIVDSGQRRPTRSGRLAVVWSGSDARMSEPAADSRIAGQSARASPRPATVRSGMEACLKRGGHRFVDVPIHGGRSIRRDCAACGRFVRFTVWNQAPVKLKHGVDLTAAAGDLR